MKIKRKKKEVGVRDLPVLYVMEEASMPDFVTALADCYSLRSTLPQWMKLAEEGVRIAFIGNWIEAVIIENDKVRKHAFTRYIGGPTEAADIARRLGGYRIHIPLAYADVVRSAFYTDLRDVPVVEMPDEPELSAS